MLFGITCNTDQCLVVQYIIVALLVCRHLLWKLFLISLCSAQNLKNLRLWTWYCILKLRVAKQGVYFRTYLSAIESDDLVCVFYVSDTVDCGVLFFKLPTF